MATPDIGMLKIALESGETRSTADKNNQSRYRTHTQLFHHT